MGIKSGDFDHFFDQDRSRNHGNQYFSVVFFRCIVLYEFCLHFKSIRKCLGQVEVHFRRKRQFRPKIAPFLNMHIWAN